MSKIVKSNAAYCFKILWQIPGKKKQLQELKATASREVSGWGEVQWGTASAHYGPLMLSEFLLPVFMYYFDIDTMIGENLATYQGKIVCSI